MLYAWATARSDSPAGPAAGLWAAYDRLAAQLTAQAAGLRHIPELGGTQMWVAHVVAKGRGLNAMCLPAGRPLYAAAEKANAQRMQGAQKTAAREQFVASLAGAAGNAAAGSKVSTAEISADGLKVIDVVLRGPGYPRGIAIRPYTQVGWLQHPRGQLSGIAIAVAAQLCQSYDALIVAPRHNKGSDAYYAHIRQLVSSTVQTLQQHAVTAGPGAKQPPGLVVNGWWEGSQAAWAAEAGTATAAAEAPAPASSPATATTAQPAAAVAAPAPVAAARPAAAAAAPHTSPATPAKPALTRPALPRTSNGLLW